SATDYLADGITESLINQLSRVASLKVMSRNSVFRYKTDDAKLSFPDAKTIGRELGVRAVLIGRIRQVDSILIVSVELIDAADNTHLWGGQYNREPSDILARQNSLSQQIAEVLRVRLTSADKQELAKRQTENSEAYHLYLKGRFYWNKLTPDGVGK